MRAESYTLDAVEFACFTAVAILLAFSSLSKLWLAAPVAGFLIAILYARANSVKEEHKRVAVQLQQLHRLALRQVPNPRCTYFVPIWGGKLLQACDYIPTGGGAGRKFPAGKGIIGRAFSVKETCVESFASDAEFRSAMVSKYGYKPEDLGLVSADRRSYFCYPLVDDDGVTVRGLVYADSTASNKFQSGPVELMDNLNELTRTLCIGIRDSVCT